MNADPRAIIKDLHIIYDNPTPNKKRTNEADFSAAYNVAMLIEDYLFRLE